MGAVERERGVLKLVHPGRYVEIHREPIKASEVLKKNPRHSVTRPDVFEYPWIVVRPESMLNVGKVFYIVPNTTIYKLIDPRARVPTYTSCLLRLLTIEMKELIISWERSQLEKTK